jgi:hypothetical protein
MVDGTDESVLKQRRQLQEMARSYRQSQILLTCVELGVFEALANHRAAASEIAVVIGTDNRGMELLLNAAAALGLLEKKEGYFANTSLTESCISPSGANSLAHSLRLESVFYQRWGHLAEAVRTGKRPEENRRDEQPEE